MRVTFTVVICTILIAPLVGADKEYESHGAGSPHDKRTKDHYSGDKHNAEFDHEAVLGSRKDAEEFDSLSPEQSKKRLAVLAKRMDADSDGQVTKEELATFIEGNLRQLDQEEIEERFSEIDTNADGKISWQEYLVDAFGEDGADEEQGLNVDEEDKRLMEEDERYFNAADTNGDKVLTKEEFAAFQNPEGFDHMFPSLSEVTLLEKDTDKDGFISLEEFLAPNEKSDAEWVSSEKSRFQTEYDKDGDGKLSRDELKAWLIPNLAKTALDEAVHLIAQADKNDDEKLTIQEIVDNHELFVGSEATNYGESLEKIPHEEL